MQATITTVEGTRDIVINTLEELAELIRVHDITAISTGMEDGQVYFHMLASSIDMEIE
jgi:hypothetical protein